MTNEYKVDIEGLHRSYPIVNLSEGNVGVYFFMPGDVELIEHCARLIAEKIRNSCDLLVVPEVGGIPLAHATAHHLGLDYLVIRKSVKPYMLNPISEKIQSITTDGIQELVIDGRDIERVQGKKIVLIDDVVSSLGTLRGLFKLAKKFSAQVTHVACVFLEGQTSRAQVEEEFGCSLISFAHLPLFPEQEENAGC